MEMYIKFNHYRLWLVITNEYIPIPRPKAEWTNTNLSIMELNKKACYTYTLTCALSRNEYNKIFRLKRIGEVWDSMSLNYEGIEDVQRRGEATWKIATTNTMSSGRAGCVARVKSK